MALEIKNFQTTRRFAAEKMQKLNLLETERFFSDVYCLEPGQEQKAHAHAGSDKIYAVLEGEVEVRIGGEAASLKSGEMVLAPSGSEHGVKNVSGARAALLVFMAPHP